MVITMYDTLIYLVKVNESTDAVGDVVYSEVLREVFAELKSVGMKEFYEAMAKGLKPELVFELADYLEYSDEPLVEYEGTRYKVLRTYRKGRKLEIVVYGGVHGKT